MIIAKDDLPLQFTPIRFPNVLLAPHSSELEPRITAVPVPSRDTDTGVGPDRRLHARCTGDRVDNDRWWFRWSRQLKEKNDDEAATETCSVPRFSF